MAETTEKTYHEHEEPVQIEEESDKHESVAPKSQFLAELNLVMLIAALAVSGEDLLASEDTEKVIAKEQEVKTFMSKLESRKRAFSELRIPDRHAPRLQAKTLDCRHGRKM